MTENTKDCAIEEIDASVDALMDIQFAIIDIMDEKFVTKKDLAKKLNTTPVAISRLLSSQANPTIKQIGRIFWALGVERPFIYLVPRENDIAPKQHKGNLND